MTILRKSSPAGLLKRSLSWCAGALCMLLALSLQSCVVSDLSNRFDPKNGGFILGDFLGSSGSGSSSGGCVFDGGNFDSCNFAN